MSLSKRKIMLPSKNANNTITERRKCITTEREKHVTIVRRHITWTYDEKQIDINKFNSVIITTTMIMLNLIIVIMNNDSTNDKTSSSLINKRSNSRNKKYPKEARPKTSSEIS